MTAAPPKAPKGERALDKGERALDKGERALDKGERALDKGERAQDKSERTFNITQLAQEFDVTPRAIRFYEDMGLLTPARDGRNRVYAQRDRTRLKLTLRGKRLGLSLQEVKQLVDMYESPSDTAQQLEAFLVVLGEHRGALERQLEDIEVTLAEIAQHEERCRRLLAEGRRRGATKARGARLALT